MNTPLPVTNTRPGTVTTAALIQLLLAASGVVTIALGLIYGATINNAMRESLEADGVAANEAEMMATAGGNDIFTMSINVIMVGLFVVLAVLVMRGNNVGRIITWVVSGIGLARTALGTAMMGAMTAMNDAVGINEAMADGFAAAGGWYSPLLTTLSILSLIGYIAVIVLLVLPASHPYFRKAGPEVQLPPEVG